MRRLTTVLPTALLVSFAGDVPIVGRAIRPAGAPILPAGGGRLERREIRGRPYDHPDATDLIAELQTEYVVRYGDMDATPADPAQFAPPRGRFLLAYDDGDRPVACGGWRAGDPEEPGLADGDAEIKRMYVRPHVRGNGVARRLLAALENSAAGAGQSRIVLETGTAQPEAIGLYTSSGYLPIEPFGIHRCTDGGRLRCFGKPLPTPGEPQ